MLSATVFRTIATLRRNPFETASMLVRPLVSAVLYAVFALFYLGGSEGIGFMCASLAIMNLITNAAIGGAFEARGDAGEGRLDSIMLAPGGFGGFVRAEAAVQTVVAFAESAVVVLAASPWMRIDAGSIFLLTAGMAALLAFTFSWASIATWVTVRTERFVQCNFAVMLLVTLAGSFWPVQMLPPVFEAIARANPLTYAIDLVRVSLAGGEHLIDPACELAVAAGLAAATAAVALAVTSIRGDFSGIQRN